MDITPNKLTISQLFDIQNEQFVIPSYQRRYAWGEKQYGALFDDIDMLKESDNHLLGMIILRGGGIQAGGLNKPELVDGQQRLASLLLLILAIKNRYLELGKKEKAKEFDRNLYCKDFDDVVQNKLVFGDLDDPDYQKILHQKDLEKVQNTKLLSAYQDFKSWLSEYDYSELNRFTHKLNSCALLIRLDVGLAKDAYKLFETINNRGLRLSPTDLIKNFILGHAAKHDDATLEEVKQLWAEIITNLDNIDTNTFLRQYTCAILERKITLNYLIDLFKKHYMKNVRNTDLLSEYDIYSDELDIDEENENNESIDIENGNSEDNDDKADKDRLSIIQFITKIRDASGVYQKIRMQTFKNKKINRSLNNLQRIRSLPTYIFLLDLFQRELDEKKIIKILKILEVFMVRRNVCLYRTHDLDEIFSKLIRVRNENIIEDIKENLREHMPSDEEFNEFLPKNEFAGLTIDRAKYILEQIEYYLIGNKGEIQLTSGSELHLEHIIPLTIKTKKSKNEYGDWLDYLGEDAISKHKKYVHRIGNMTLLAEELNISAYNNPFSKKKTHYKKSVIKLNKQLCEEYNQFKFKQIDKRGKELAEIALKIWKF